MYPFKKEDRTQFKIDNTITVWPSNRLAFISIVKTAATTPFLSVLFTFPSKNAAPPKTREQQYSGKSHIGV